MENGPRAMLGDYTEYVCRLHSRSDLHPSHSVTMDIQPHPPNGGCESKKQEKPPGRQQRNRLCFMEGTLSLFTFKKSSFQGQEPWEKPAILSDTFYFQQLISQDEGDTTAAQGFLGLGLEHSKATPTSSLRLQMMHLSPVKPFKSYFWT